MPMMSGIYSATDQLDDLIYTGSGVERPVEPPSAQPAGYRPPDAYESGPAPEPMAPAGTPPPPTATNTYPTAGPPGNAYPGTEVGYGQQITPDASYSATPASAPLNFAAAEPYGVSDRAIHAGGDSNTLRSQGAYSPPPLTHRVSAPATSPSAHGNPNTSSGSAMYGSGGVKAYNNGYPGTFGQAMGSTQAAPVREPYQGIPNYAGLPARRRRGLLDGVPENLLWGLNTDPATADNGVYWDDVMNPGGWLSEPQYELDDQGNPIYGRGEAFIMAQPFGGGSAGLGSRNGRAPRSSRPVTAGREMPSAPESLPLPEPAQPLRTGGSPGPRSYPTLAQRVGATTPDGGIVGPGGRVVYPRTSQVATPNTIPLPAKTQSTVPGTTPGFKGVPGTSPPPGASPASRAIPGTSPPPLSPQAQAALNQAQARARMTTQQRAQAQNAARVQAQFTAPATAPNRGGWGAKKALAALAGTGLAVGSAFEAADQTTREPSPFTQGESLRQGLGPSGWSTMPDGSRVRASDPFGQQADYQDGSLPSRPAFVLDLDGAVTPSERTSDAYAAGTGNVNSAFPGLSAFHISDAGDVSLVPTTIPEDAMQAAIARGEGPAQLNDAEFDALLAAGLIVGADGNPIPDADVEDWRAALTSTPFLAPAAWVRYITGASEDVTFTPVDETATDTGVDSSTSDSWSNDDTYSGGNTYTRRSSGGGGGYSNGGGYGYPGTSPDMAAFFGGDFMDGFMDGGGQEGGPWDNPIFDRYFATRDGGSRFGNPSSRRSGRSSRRRGMRGRSGRIMQNPRSRSASTPTPGSPNPSSTSNRSGLVTGGSEAAQAALAAALALQERR